MVKNINYEAFFRIDGELYPIGSDVRISDIHSLNFVGIDSGYKPIGTEVTFSGNIKSNAKDTYNKLVEIINESRYSDITVEIKDKYLFFIHGQGKIIKNIGIAIDGDNFSATIELIK